MQKSNLDSQRKLMNKLKYFKKWSDRDGNIYSLDMLRLNIDVGDNLKALNGYIQGLADVDLRYEIKYYPSFAQYKYRHLWNVSSPIDDGVSLSLGLDLGGSAEARHKGFIEFNPNKCETSSLLHGFIARVMSYCVTVDLVRYDLAIDVLIDRTLARLERFGRKHYQYIDSGNGITEYLGQRNTSGYIKLYDKTKESNLTDTYTRLEITLDSKTDISSVFPTVRLNDTQQALPLDTDLSETDKVLIALLRKEENPQYYLSQLLYRKRKKIEPYLADRVLNLDNKLALNVKTLALYYENYYKRDFDKIQ